MWVMFDNGRKLELKLNKLPQPQGAVDIATDIAEKNPPWANSPSQADEGNCRFTHAFSGQNLGQHTADIDLMELVVACTQNSAGRNFEPMRCASMIQARTASGHAASAQKSCRTDGICRESPGKKQKTKQGVRLAPTRPRSTLVLRCVFREFLDTSFPGKG